MPSKLTKQELLFLVKKAETYGMRFTLSKKFVCFNPVSEQWEQMRYEDAERLFVEAYNRGRKHSKHLTRRQKDVPETVREFFGLAFSAVGQYDPENLEKHSVSTNIIEVEDIQ